ncbi:hypothetical protein HPB50_006116 [Hyalomma asiaticum]|uniref:Uncharacterized protein n=1 Tax=Hyalomma asiaticum TaxID=266040 RepID=A0ACB7T874_HYAAI|nr:hypothetical protein HPB50_006116 [Hyalomma asiaticum]
MPFSLIFLVAIAMVATSEWHLYLARAVVPVEDGKCLYNGTEITPGEPLLAEYPCEKWICAVRDSETGFLDVTGCGSVAVLPGCKKVRGTGVYPDCCEDSVCGD